MVNSVPFFCCGCLSDTSRARVDSYLCLYRPQAMSRRVENLSLVSEQEECMQYFRIWFRHLFVATNAFVKRTSRIPRPMGRGVGPRSRAAEYDLCLPAMPVQAINTYIELGFGDWTSGRSLKRCTCESVDRVASISVKQAASAASLEAVAVPPEHTVGSYSASLCHSRLSPSRLDVNFAQPCRKWLLARATQRSVEIVARFSRGVDPPFSVAHVPFCPLLTGDRR